MKITIYLRRDQVRPTHFTMRTDFTRERDDTPRIGNFGLEIKNILDGIIERCEKEGVVRVSKVGEI